MKQFFRDRQGSLRNGWWILLFLALFVASQPVYTLASKAVQRLGVGLTGQHRDAHLCARRVQRVASALTTEPSCRS